METQFIASTGVTFPVLVNGSSTGATYGAYTNDYFIVNPDGIVTYITRYYDEAGLQAELDRLTTGVDEPRGKNPASFRLKQNYPNPFNPGTTIEYELQRPAHVQLVITNLMGETIRILENSYKQGGSYRVHWDGRNDAQAIVPAGLYIYSLRAGERTQSRRMLLLK